MSSYDVSRRDFLSKAAPIAAAAAAAGTALSARAADEPAATKPLKILGVSCSPRKGHNTATVVQIALEAARAAAPAREIEFIDLGGMKIDCCVAAGVDLAPGERDDFPPLVPKLTDPSVAGIILGTPVYFGNMSGLCKSFIDRWHVFFKEKKLTNKVGGVVATGGGRNGGMELTIRSVQAAMTSHQMIVIGDAPPTSHWGGTVWAGAGPTITADEFGISTAKNLGRRVAEVALLLARR